MFVLEALGGGGRLVAINACYAAPHAPQGLLLLTVLILFVLADHLAALNRRDYRVRAAKGFVSLLTAIGHLREVGTTASLVFYIADRCGPLVG